MSLNGDSEDEEVQRLLEFNEVTNMFKPVLKVGLKFSTAQVFRNALREWNVQHGFDIKFTKNEGKRVTAICINECGWRIHASPM